MASRSDPDAGWFCGTTGDAVDAGVDAGFDAGDAGDVSVDAGGSGSDAGDAGVTVDASVDAGISAWQGALVVSSDTGNLASPKVAFLSSGEAIVVFQGGEEQGQEFHQVRAVWYRADGTWTPTTVLHQDAGLITNLHIAAASDVMAVWREQPQQAEQMLRSIRFASAGGWLAAETIVAQDGGSALVPKAAISGSGSGLVAWVRRYAGETSTIWAGHLPNAPSGLVSTTQISSGAVDASSPQVGFVSDASALVVWFDDNDRWLGWSRFQSDPGLWVDAGTVSLATTEAATDLQLATRGAGRAVVTWMQDAGIYARWFSESGEWGTPFLINGLAGGESPRAAVDSMNNAIVVWSGLEGTATSLYASRAIADDAGWSSAMVVGRNVTGDVATPRIASDSAGNMVVVWRAKLDAGSQARVAAVRFDKSVGSWGDAGFIDGPSKRTPTNLSIAASATGIFVVVWEDELDGGQLTTIWANVMR